MGLAKLISIVLLTFTSINLAIAADISEYNLTEGNLGIKGYDPVAYHSEAGGSPQLGNPNISLEYKGVLYYFVNEDNRELFKSNSEKYEPTFGGWCAYVIANGYKADPNPRNFDVQDGRLLLFVDGTETPWFANREDFTFNAVENWFDLTDEDTFFDL